MSAMPSRILRRCEMTLWAKRRHCEKRVPACMAFIFLERHTKANGFLLWSRQHNTANSRKNAVALLNQPRQTSNEKYCCKWKRFGRSLRKTLRLEQLRAKLVDLVLQRLMTIRIGLVSLCQSQPCVRHLQENSTLLFIPSGLSYFQT